MLQAEGINRRFALASLAVLGLLASILVSVLLAFVSSSGTAIPTSDVISDYAIGVLWAIGIGVTIPLWPIPLSDRFILFALWLVRCLVTLGFMLYYEGHYGLDAYMYVREALRGNSDWDQVVFGGGTNLIIALIGTLNHTLPLGSSYHATKVLFSLVGLCGIYLIYRTAVSLLGREAPKLLFFLGLFPSILFWSSILGKDPIHLFAIALYCYGLLHWQRDPRLWFVVLTLAGIALASAIRLWSGPILIAPMVVFMMYGLRQPIFKLLMLGTTLFLFWTSLQTLNQRFEIQSVEQLTETTQVVSRSWNHGGSRQEVPEFKSTGDFVRFTPVAMASALFRPLPGEVRNPFGTMAGLENLFLLLLLVNALAGLRLRTLADPTVLWAMTLILVWSFTYGFVCYQNMGTSVRFKLQILPILVCLLLHLSVAGTAARRVASS